MRAGSNLPEFRSVQLDFAGHIRNPETNPIPAGIEPRRMKIYAELFYNNIKSFLDSAFPIARQIVGEVGWHRLAREFLHLHGSESPYFLQISEEFLTFLYARGLDGLPPFLLELCHYEWVELSLDVAVEDAQSDSFDAQGALSGMLVCSPLVRALAYSYPVHKIGIDHQPAVEPSFEDYSVGDIVEVRAVVGLLSINDDFRITQRSVSFGSNQETVVVELVDSAAFAAI